MTLAPRGQWTPKIAVAKTRRHLFAAVAQLRKAAAIWEDVDQTYNLPGQGKFWIDTPELQDDCYGILLEPGDYSIVKLP